MRFQFQQIFFLLIFFFLFIGCDREDKPEEPKLPEIATVTSETEAIVTHTSVEITGAISESDSEIISFGVVWGKNPNPTLEDNVVPGGETSSKSAAERKMSQQEQETFTVKVTNLNSGETYYFRTFATNQAGTAYGGQITLATNSLAGSSWEITFDQNTYPYLAQVSFYQDGTVYTDFEIPELNDFWGLWSMEGNHLTYQVHEDYEDIYILTGEVQENEISGTYNVYSEGAMEERTFTGELLSSEAE